MNGQNTRDGGTHLAAYREAIAKTLKEFFKKDYAPEDVRQGVIGAISIRSLGEISPDEFKDFIGAGMRLDPVTLSDEESISEIMEFYMGDNTIERQNFIRGNLRREEELEDVNI